MTVKTVDTRVLRLFPDERILSIYLPFIEEINFKEHFLQTSVSNMWPESSSFRSAVLPLAWAPGQLLIMFDSTSSIKDDDPKVMNSGA